MGKEDYLTAGVHFLPRPNPLVSMHVNYYEDYLAEMASMGIVFE